MERFATLIVAGGVALVAGLWVAAATDPLSSAWLVGVALALLGAVGNVAGIVSEIEI